MLAFATDSGTVHGWDLRNRARAWGLKVGPQAGYITSIAVPPEGDALWLVAGTSRGLVLLFDLRFRVLLKAWRHSSHGKVHRLYISRSTCSDPFVFICAGEDNDFGLYNIDSGKLVQAFRTCDTSVDAASVAKTAVLEPVSIESLAPLSSMYHRNGLWEGLAVGELGSAGSNIIGPASATAKKASAAISSDSTGSKNSVRAVLCPFDTVESNKHFSAHLPPAVISAGTDRRVRYWHTQDPSLCYSLFDQEFGSTSPQYWDMLGTNVSVCREVLSNHADPAHQPTTEGRGLPHPSSNHEDAILDMAYVNSFSSFHSAAAAGSRNPGFLLTASRDGVVKAWV
jgi:phosphoinositide-3-kinase regulatory subunit 4